MLTSAEKTWRFSRIVEIGTNLAVLVVASLLSVVLVKTYLLPTAPLHRQASRRPADGVSVGTDLSKRLTSDGWGRNSQTLLLVLSTHCHFCSESAPFFRRIRENIGKDVKLMGVLPETVAESEFYLKNEGVHLDEVKQMSLDKLGVAGTPTMLLVNPKGVVTATWVGKLDPDRQEEALKTIGSRFMSPKNVASLE